MPSEVTVNCRPKAPPVEVTSRPQIRKGPGHGSPPGTGMTHDCHVTIPLPEGSSAATGPKPVPSVTTGLTFPAAENRRLYTVDLPPAGWLVHARIESPDWPAATVTRDVQSSTAGAIATAGPSVPPWYQSRAIRLTCWPPLLRFLTAMIANVVSPPGSSAIAVTLWMVTPPVAR